MFTTYLIEVVEKITLISENRISIKVFEQFEYISKHRLNIDEVMISYGCVNKRRSKPVMKESRVELLNKLEKSIKK